MDHLSKYLALRIALEERHPERPGEEPGTGETAEAAVADGERSRAGGSAHLEDVSEKQYTIYTTTSNEQFSVSTTDPAVVMHDCNHYSIW